MHLPEVCNLAQHSSDELAGTLPCQQQHNDQVFAAAGLADPKGGTYSITTQPTQAPDTLQDKAACLVLQTIRQQLMIITKYRLGPNTARSASV